MTPVDQPKILLSTGRLAFGLSLVAFGVQSLIRSDFVPGLEPAPSWMGHHILLSIAPALLLIVTGCLLAINKKRRATSLTLVYLFLCWLIFLHLPIVFSNPTNGGAWTAAFETVALLGFAGTLAYFPAPITKAQSSSVSGFSIMPGRLCFGLALPAFGLLHFLYSGYVASVIPDWIPVHRFWAYFIGVIFFLAGGSIVSGFKAYLTSILVGMMFGLWVIVLHAPRVLARPQSPAEWSSLFVAMAMAGGAWISAAGLARNKSGFSLTFAKVPPKW